MSKDVKKALEHCIDNECAGCPNNEELGSGETVCRARLLPKILEYISDLQHRLEVAERTIQLLSESNISNVMEEERQPMIDYIKELAESELKGE